MVGANTPPELGTFSSATWLGRVSAWPIWVQFTRSALSNSGTPGKYWKELAAR